eukprot:TRINITY_DN13758_c0_g1_i2.p1 TRINITY_DN13758_c0_g1~~TRINITY_DN13758_c0_g1_i2.p1  ORF type:complete len:115 (-),score=24.39 TRINITY_DN13758_c0_g1_i2:86-430(-)
MDDEQRKRLQELRQKFISKNSDNSTNIPNYHSSPTNGLSNSDGSSSVSVDILRRIPLPSSSLDISPRRDSDRKLNYNGVSSSPSFKNLRELVVNNEFVYEDDFKSPEWEIPLPK